VSGLTVPARGAWHAEWTKLRTVPGPGWLLAGLIATTVGISAAADAATRCPAAAACPDPARLTLTGADLGQVLAAMLAVAIIGGEYSTGMIHLSAAAVPRRITLLGAKAAVLTVVVLAAGVAAVLGSLLAGRLILPGHGFTAGHGVAALSLAAGPVLRATAGSVLYLALIGLLSLGVAAVVRDPAAAAGTVLGLLYLFPIAAGVVPDPYWRRHLEQAGPMTAGLAIQDTTGLHNLPLSPWAGLGVLAAWAAGALLAGGLLLWWRDV